MKKLITLSLALVFITSVSIAQKKTVPSVKVETLTGKSINTSTISNDGKPIIISFWATWCKPCKEELNNIADEYEDWIDETGVKLIAVSIDDTRSATRVKPYVNSVGWEYEVLLDKNSDFKRAMGVQNVPHTFLIDGNGNIIYSHNSYAPGDEDKLYEKVKAAAGVK
ncbi:MAG: cytochrome c biogenesis protein CcmG/thiol:disulfide interchange protein DsbE [Parvicellaceae bacterium]|jgi:cytochrome c biogenesis protein CcmG/thiol:disulfide interchange protein DsbE